MQDSKKEMEMCGENKQSRDAKERRRKTEDECTPAIERVEGR